MAQYIFSSDRQLIFYVTVSGRTRLVQFGERSQWGASNFSTNDEKLASAIRRHSMFKRGVICETTPKEKDTAAMPERTDGGSVGKTGGHRKQAGVGKKSAAATAEDSAPTDSENVIEVENFTQAREAIIKRLGVGKNEVKTPVQLQKVAKEAGISIKYNKK